MKKLTTIMAAGLAVLAYHTASAQVGLHVSFNLGGVGVHSVYSQPAPVQYVDNAYGDDYYYLPDAEAYYSVPQHCYYYNDGRQWVSAAYLPGRFHDLDWRNARRYEIRGDRPFMHHDMYRTRYGGFDPRFGGGYANNRFDNRGGFDRPMNDNRGGFDRPVNDNRGGFGGPMGGNFDNRDRRHDNNDFQNGNRGGFDQPQNNRGGQYQNDQNRGGGNWNNQQPANNGGQYQNGNQNRGGGMNQQPANNGGGQNGGQFNGGQNRGAGMDQQPANSNGGQNGGRNGQGGMRSGSNDNHFATNQMGVMRPPRF